MIHYYNENIILKRGDIMNKHVQTALDVETYLKLKTYSIRNSIPIRDLIKKIIKEFIEKEENGEVCD
jgi:hypothetical protein